MNTTIYDNMVLLGVAAVSQRDLDNIVNKTLDYYKSCNGTMTIEECAGVIVFNSMFLDTPYSGVGLTEDFGQKLLTEKVVDICKKRIEQKEIPEVLDCLERLYKFLNKHDGEKITGDFDKRFDCGFFAHALDVFRRGYGSEVLDLTCADEEVKDKWRNYYHKCIAPKKC